MVLLLSETLTIAAKCNKSPATRLQFIPQKIKLISEQRWSETDFNK